MTHSRRFLIALACAGVLAGCDRSVEYENAGTDDATPSTGIGAEAPAPADVVFRGGAVYTVNAAQPWAEAVAVRGSRIIYVGEDESLDDLIGTATRVIELEGRMLLPGLIDTHSHSIGGSFSTRDGNLNTFDSLALLRAELQRIARDNPGDDLIMARGFQNHIFPPEGPPKEMLDEIFGDRPVLITSVDGHSLWASSRAIEMAGVTAETADPEPGVSFIERDPETGEPLGTFREGASALITSKIVERDPATYEAAFRDWLPRAAEAGLTGMFDAGFGAPTIDDAFRMLSRLEDEGALTMRFFGAITHNIGADDTVERYERFAGSYGGEYFEANAIKAYTDGVPEAHTSYFLEPYDDRPESRGAPMMPRDRIFPLVRDANARGIRVHVHAIGDAAVRLALDAFENAQQVTGRDHVRNAIAHMDFVHPADIKRFRDLGVVAQTSIQWAAKDPSYYNIGQFVGLDRMDRAYPVRSIIDAGVIQTFGADWPAAAYFSTFKPLDLIEVGHTRRLPGDAEMPARNADERLGLPDLIRGMTLWAAWQVGKEDDLGSIEPGKAADLVVLAENLFDIEPHRIHGVGVDLTMMDGRVVWEAENRQATREP